MARMTAAALAALAALATAAREDDDPLRPFPSPMITLTVNSMNPSDIEGGGHRQRAGVL